VWLFYRVDCVGRPPVDGPAILLPNHPNALLDPALVWATAGRDIRFLAKSTLFDGFLKPLVAGAGAIPVYRRHDKGVDASKNTETFAAVEAALADGDAICLFPEGVSHSSGQLEPLRTGAARMALAAERAGTSVALVPVGLNFERKTSFRSRVTVAYGKAFSCADLLPSDEPNTAAVRALTDRIAERMRHLLIEADPKADAALVERVERLYSAARGRPRDGAERVARRRTIAAGMKKLRDVDLPRYETILLRLRRYDERLHRFGFGDRHLDWNVSTADAIAFGARELLVALALGPLALAAVVIFFVPYHLTGFAARQFTSELDVAATAKVVAGIVLYGVWLAALAALAWSFGGTRVALVTALLIPVLAVAGLFAFERESAILDTVRAWFLLRRARHETRERLRKDRSELADVLDEVSKVLGF
jgi:1-acyl-sn-glycerol-3-phosphate acyltransferase